MADIITGRTTTSNSISNGTNEGKTSDIAVVYDVVLDENNEYVKTLDEKVRLSYIGAIKCRYIDGFGVNIKDLPLVKPLDKTLKDLPVINEQVRIVSTGLGTFYERLEPTNETPNNGAVINQISYKIQSKPDDTLATPNVNTYQETQATQIATTNNNTDYTKYNKFGKYFKFTSNIHKLKLFEGDYLIESRFGQSIRFSAYNNLADNPTFSPTVIIRNGESDLNRVKNVFQTVEEDINRDGSIIALTSKDYQLGFQPGTLDDKGVSNFETKADSFVDYPQTLKGDQLLLSSGRVILSAKNAEMIFYSKKNYGFISDGGLSIDNKKGVDINVKDNVNIVTNDKDVNIVTGNNGKIYLGTKDLEPMVKGKQLVTLLGELIDAIGFLQFKTPAGPSAIGSENRKDFENIKGKLNNILSSLNQTA